MQVRIKEILLSGVLGALTLAYGFIILVLSTYAFAFGGQNQVPFLLLSGGGIAGLAGLWMLMLYQKPASKLVRTCTAVLLYFGMVSAAIVAVLYTMHFSMMMGFVGTVMMTVGLPMLVVVTAYSMTKKL